MRTIQQIQREDNVGYVDASIIQDAERLAKIKENMTATTATEIASNYSTHQLLDILAEARRNIVAGNTLLNYGSYDHAARSLEIAAAKLRLVQAEYDLSAR